MVSDANSRNGNVFEAHISYYDFCNKPGQTTIKNLQQIIDIIKSDTLKKHCDKIKELHAQGKEEERRAYKARHLPGFTAAGTFSYRAKTKLIEASGLAALDIDDYTAGKNLKNDICKEPCVVLAFESPTGGLKVIVKIKKVKNFEEYEQIYVQLLNYFAKYSADNDISNKDISRLCFLSHDPRLYINENAIEFFLAEPLTAKLQKPTSDKNGKDTSRSAQEYGEVCRLIKKGLDKKAVFDRMMAWDKWAHAPESYREKTFEKAVDACENAQVGMVQLPGTNRPISEFAADIAPFFENSLDIFYKPNENVIVEIAEYYDKLQKQNNVGLRPVNAKRLLTILEGKISFYQNRFNMNTKEWERKVQSPTEQQVSILMCSDIFLNKLNQLNRLSFYPLPFIENGKMQLPIQGYDDRLQAYFCHNLPEFEYMKANEAKEKVEDLLADFCFLDQEKDKVMAWAYILTPACRGLYIRPTCRSPAFLIKANRERAGKDYLAGVVGCIYEGRAIDDSPLSTGDWQKNNEELRKKLTSAIKQGRRRYHSSNNKGRLDIAVLEQFLTSEEWRDRELGKNNEILLRNEIDFSLSANVGITYPPDLWYRCRPINLFYSEEDPNSRAFTKPDLHGYIIQNRGEILNAIYSLIKDWIEAGQPHGKSLFTSFPEWARVVGGIMTHHGLGDPCQPVEDDGVGGDKDTQDMKTLFEHAYEKKISPVTPSQIMDKLRDEWQDEIGIFSNIDLSAKGGRTTFGLMLQKFVGRTLSDIKLIVDDPKQRPARRKYTFYNPNIEKPKEKDGNLATIGNIPIPIEIKKGVKNIEGSANLTNPYQVTSLKPSEASPLEIVDEDFVSDGTTGVHVDIHHKCNYCGLTPCAGYDRKGRPICELCIDNPNVSK